MVAKKVLIYSHDTYGLGNIRRMVAIAERLVENDPAVSVLILSGSPMFHAFRIEPRIDYVKLPCLSRTREGEYVVKSLGVSFDQMLQVRSNLILSTVQNYEPDLILVDKKPFGVERELRAALSWSHTCAVRPQHVLLLRDIIDDPAVTVPIWRKNRYQEAITEFYEKVIVIGDRDVFDLIKEYELSDACAARVEFCGYLGRRLGERTASQARESHGIDSEAPMVLVTVGGGEDGVHILDTYLQGLRDADGDPGFDTVMICGPELAAGHRRRIEYAAQSLGVRVIEFCDDIMAVMQAADAIVCMGGYNTICETLTAATPSVVIPRRRPVSEQLVRARRLARKGLLRYIDPDELSPGVLMKNVTAALGSGPGKHPSEIIDLNGSERISRVIDDLLHPYSANTHRQAKLR